MNPISEATIRQVAAEAPKRAPAASAEVAKQSVRQEGDAVTEARDAAAAEEARVSEQRLEQALEQINAKASGMSPALRFEPDADSGVVIIKVLNRETGEVIRQLPPEAVVKAAETGESLPSLVDASA